MKKIPTLFTREFENHNVKKVLPQVAEGLEFILENDDVIPTVKWDGSCCAIINGEFYKRYDAKQGKAPPKGALPCCKPDPITGHWPHWVKVDMENPSDKWFVTAYNNFCSKLCENEKDECCDGTYEAIGPHFQNNPYNLVGDTLVKHGVHPLSPDMNFDGIKDFLKNNNIEGIVFWYKNEPVCKIKRSDFGYPWPSKS